MDANRLYTCKNPYQGTTKKVLCVCSAGLLRSPTAAVVLSQEPFNYNTRAAGIHDYALVQVDSVLVTWADEIVVMEKYMLDWLTGGWDKAPPELDGKPIIVLDIKDQYEYRNPELMALIKQRYLETS